MTAALLCLLFWPIMSVSLERKVRRLTTAGCSIKHRNLVPLVSCSKFHCLVVKPTVGRLAIAWMSTCVSTKILERKWLLLFLHSVKQAVVSLSSIELRSLSGTKTKNALELAEGFYIQKLHDDCVLKLSIFLLDSETQMLGDSFRMT